MAPEPELNLVSDTEEPDYSSDDDMSSPY